jgi:aspartate aminotransferase-like enzyme
MMKNHLLTPGPTPVPPQVAAKAALPILHHRTHEFGEIFSSVTAGLKGVFMTQGDVLLLSTSGTGAMESAVANLLSPGEEAIVASCGAFGERWGKICVAYGAKPIFVRSEWGTPTDPEAVRKALKEHPKAGAVFLTHTETSAGTVNDLKALGSIIRETDAVCVVDAISGLAGQELRMDAWNLDCVVAGSQKGLMCPPGLAMAALTAKAWKKVESSKSPRFYWDYRTIRASVPQNETPWTPPVTLIVGLSEALHMIQEEGLENVWKRHLSLSRAAQAGLKALGLKLFSTAPCSVLTSVYAPDGIKGEDLVKRMRVELGVSIAGGQEHLKGKIVRLAHMGYMDFSDLVIGLSALERMLGLMGYRVPEPGRAGKEAQAALVS